MDTDHLFVCFSQDALSPTDGSPPFHESIQEFTANIDVSSFKEFFEGRRKWHWYPIITSGLSSFPVHGDLPDHLSDQQMLQAVGWAATICSQEDGKGFISALGLLSLMCRSVNEPKPVPALSKHFMTIRKAVTRNTIDPNIPYWFSKVVLFQLQTGIPPENYTGSFDRSGLNAPDKGWKGYGTSLDFPVVDDNGWQNCPDKDKRVQKEIESISGGEFVLEFKRSAIKDGNNYWIWLYRNISEKPVYHWYIYLVQHPDGETEVCRHSMHSVVNLSPEELVAKHAFECSS
jgi:hypothetical protein